MTATTSARPAVSVRASASGEVSTWRLNALRVLYFMMALFLVSAVGPLLFQAAPTHMTSVGRALLTGLGLLALLGVRYPLQMLPLMLFEFVWKALWLSFYGLPAWFAGDMDPAYAMSLKETDIGIILVIIVVPWKYAFDRYVAARGERWH